MSAPPESLVVVAPCDLRELCFSLPATRALAAAIPGLTVLFPACQQAFWDLSGISGLLPYPTDATARRIAPLLDGHPAALLWEAGAAADACVRAGVSERIGLPAAGLAKRLTRPLERRIEPGPAEHEVRRYLDTARELGVDPMQAEFFAALETGVERDPQRMLLVPGSDYGGHFEWPIERWAELAGELRREGRTLEVGGPEPAAAALAGQLDLPRLAPHPADPAPLAAYGWCVAADGSLPHLAAAVGTPCAVLFGPGDPERHRPLGKQHVWIRRKAECAPCQQPKCPLDLRCQNELEVRRVLDHLPPLAELSPA